MGGKHRICGICPKCKINDKRVSKKGYVYSYCQPCLSKYRRVKNPLKRNFSWGKDYWGFSHLFFQKKKGAQKRKLSFNLSKPHFKELCLSNCFHCNKPPSNQTTHNGKLIQKNSGIDRINNDIGYEPDNVVSCCWDCNRLRGSVTIEEFLNHCQRVVDFQRFK